MASSQPPFKRSRPSSASSVSSNPILAPLLSTPSRPNPVLGPLLSTHSSPSPSSAISQSSSCPQSQASFQTQSLIRQNLNSKYHPNAQGRRIYNKNFQTHQYCPPVLSRRGHLTWMPRCANQHSTWHPSITSPRTGAYPANMHAGNFHLSKGGIHLSYNLRGPKPHSVPYIASLPQNARNQLQSLFTDFKTFIFGFPPP